MNLQSKSEMESYTVDVIIPTYRPDHKFGVLMKMLRKQTYEPRKVIILNTIPQSDSPEKVRREQEEYMETCEYIIKIRKRMFSALGFTIDRICAVFPQASD